MTLKLELTPGESRRVEEAKSQGVDIAALLRALINAFPAPTKPDPPPSKSKPNPRTDCGGLWHKATYDVTPVVRSVLARAIAAGLLSAHEQKVAETMMADGSIEFSEWQCLGDMNEGNIVILNP